MNATFVSRTDLTDTISSFSFRPEQTFSFTAGQYISLALSGHVEAGHTAERWFTISSSPHEALLTITTRLGHSPYKRALANLQAGAMVSISEPQGDFVLPMLLQTPLVFVVGGIGITPVHSILSWLKHTGEQRSVKVIYAVRSENDIIFQDTFEASNQHVTIVVDEPTSAWGGERGPLTAGMILGVEQPDRDTMLYLSGPEPFVQAIHTNLVQAGVSSQQLVNDEFQGYATV